METEKIQPQVLPSHIQVTRIATIANYFAWFILFYHFLWVPASYLQTSGEYFSRNAAMFPSRIPPFLEMLTQEPVYAATFFIGLFGILFRGIVSFLVLRGISLALKMILETNLNKNTSSEGDRR